MSGIREGKCEECGKNYQDITTICGHCGYSPSGATLMAGADPFWKCGNCGRTVQASRPPETCPGCGEVVISRMLPAIRRSAAGLGTSTASFRA